jgi:hypothetical protein
MAWQGRPSTPRSKAVTFTTASVSCRLSEEEQAAAAAARTSIHEAVELREYLDGR